MQKLNGDKSDENGTENQKIISNQNENRQTRQTRQNRQNKNISFTSGLELNGRCWNCEESGYKSYQCPYPFKKCPRCSHIGHDTLYECRMYWMAKRRKPITKLHLMRATVTIYDIFGRKTAFEINMDYIPQRINLKSVFETI
eukprot:UN03828